LNNPSALIIHEDKEVAEPYARVLESLGFATEILQTGEAALSEKDIDSYQDWETRSQ